MLNWRELETAIAEVSEGAFQNWIRKNPKQHPYALAFHECYRELDGQINIPQLAVNSTEKQLFADGSDDEGWKWNSADWYWLNILPSRSALPELEKLLTDEACRSTQLHWQRTEKRFYSVLVRVTKHLYRRFADHPQVADDFVVYIDDEYSDMELIRRCVPSKLYKKHFERFDEPSFEAKDAATEDRLARYLDEMYSYEKEILAFGEDAIGPLTEKLDGPDGWAAAALLADLNLPTEPVISALRKRTSRYSEMGESYAMALFLLGDVEYLFSLVENEETRPHAITGILTGLSVRASDHNPPVPLDYRYVERLLSLKSEAVEKQVAEKLKPGSSFIEIRASDVDEAIRGLESPHTVIRQHAVCIAGNRSLGKAAGGRLLPLLAEKLHDPVANVRRLALLSLSDWKAAAQPHHSQMKQLQSDKDASVRQCATYVFE